MKDDVFGTIVKKRRQGCTMQLLKVGRIGVNVMNDRMRGD